MRRPLTFEKYPIFHPTGGFSANNVLPGMLRCLFFQDLKDQRFLEVFAKCFVYGILYLGSRLGPR